MAKRAHFARGTVESAKEKMASVMGKTKEVSGRVLSAACFRATAGSHSTQLTSESQTVGGLGAEARGVVPPEPVWGTRSHIEEEALKGKAAGGTKRDH